MHPGVMLFICSFCDFFSHNDTYLQHNSPGITVMFVLVAGSGLRQPWAMNHEGFFLMVAFRNLVFRLNGTSGESEFSCLYPEVRDTNRRFGMIYKSI